MPDGLIAHRIEVALGVRLKSARPMGGGCIGEVYKVELESGTPLVAKIDRDGESHLEREAYMVRYLREKSELPVPEVYHGSETLLETLAGASAEALVARVGVQHAQVALRR